MNQVNVSRDAHADLLEVWTFIATNNPRSANRLIRSITSKFDMLVDFPDAGRSRDEVRVGLRRFAVGTYVNFYRHVAYDIEIVRVLHGARDLKTIL